MTPKIIFVSSHAKLGGAERYLEILMEGLADEAVDAILCLEEGPFVERLRKLGYSPEVISTSRRATGILRSAMKLRRRIARAGGPRVIHANNLKAALVAGLATVASRVPVVWVKHDFSSDGRLARFVGRLSERIVGVVGAVTTTFGPSFRDKVQVVPNGIVPMIEDRRRGRESVVAAIGHIPKGPIVGLVGRLHPWKGQLELVAVAPEVAGRIPGVAFVIVGGPDPTTPEYETRVREQIAASNLGDRVHLLGQRNDAVSLIAGFDLLVMPSVRDDKGEGRDAFPFVGLEAMSVGTPIIAYADGGLPEMLGDCGRTVPPADRSHLAGAIVDVLTDDALRSRMETCGKARVKERFSAATMVTAMERVYEEVSGAHRQGR